MDERRKEWTHKREKNKWKNGGTDKRKDERTNEQIILQRCDDAFEKWKV